MESAVPNGNEAATTTEPQQAPPAVREQDRLMPVANVARIMRRVLPPHAKISDDAKELIQDCVSEFIGFVTGEANERCHREHRKTVTAEDVVWAMEHLGFDDYVLPLSVYLQRMREGDGESSRGHRAVTRAAPRAPPPVPALRSVQVQMQQPMYALPAPPPARAAFGVPVPANGPSHQHVRVQYDGVLGGERSVAPYYGEATPHGAAASSRGGRADEAGSSNGTPGPAVGAGSQ